MDFELKSRSLDKEQINLSEDNRSMYDIFVLSCELPMDVGVQDRKESGAWKCYKLSNSRHRSREPSRICQKL